MWFRAEADAPRHRKVARLRRLVREDEVGDLAKAMGALYLLWAEACKLREWGALPGYSEEDVEAVCDWEGAPGKLCSALLEVGLLDRTSDGFRVHGWEKFVGRDARRKLAQGETEKREVAEPNARPGRAGGAPVRGPTSTSTSTTESQTEMSIVDPPQAETRPADAPLSGGGSRVFAEVVEAWNRGRKGCVPSANVGGAPVRDRAIQQMLKRYDATPADFEWIARSLSASDHHQRWGKATLGWVVRSAARFEEKLEDGRRYRERMRRCREAQERHEREARAFAHQEQPVEERPDHETNLEMARRVQAMLAGGERDADSN